MSDTTPCDCSTAPSCSTLDKVPPYIRCALEEIWATLCAIKPAGGDTFVTDIDIEKTGLQDEWRIKYIDNTGTKVEGTPFIIPPNGGVPDGDIKITGPTTIGQFTVTHTDSGGLTQTADFKTTPSVDPDNKITLGSDGKLFCNPVAFLADGDITITGPDKDGLYTVTHKASDGTEQVAPLEVVPSSDADNKITLGSDGKLQYVPEAPDGNIKVTGPDATGKYDVTHTDSDGNIQTTDFTVDASTDPNNAATIGTDGKIHVPLGDGNLKISGPTGSGKFTVEHTNSDGTKQTEVIEVKPSTDVDNAIRIGTDGYLWANGADQGYIDISGPDGGGTYTVNMTRFDGGIISETFTVPDSSGDGVLQKEVVPDTPDTPSTATVSPLGPIPVVNSSGDIEWIRWPDGTVGTIATVTGGADKFLQKAVAPPTPNDPSSFTPVAAGPTPILNSDSDIGWIVHPDGTIDDFYATLTDGGISVTGPDVSGEFTVTHTDSLGVDEIDNFSVVPSTDVNNIITTGTDGALHALATAIPAADGNIETNGPSVSGEYTVDHTDSDGVVQQDTFFVSPSTDADNDLVLGTDGKLYVNDTVLQIPQNPPTPDDPNSFTPDPEGPTPIFNSASVIQWIVYPDSTVVELGSEGAGTLTVDQDPDVTGKYEVKLTDGTGTNVIDDFKVEPSSDAANLIDLGTDGKLYIDTADVGDKAQDGLAIEKFDQNADNERKRVAGILEAKRSANADEVRVETWDVPEITSNWDDPDFIQVTFSGGKLLSGYDGTGDTQRPLSRDFSVPYGVGNTAMIQAELVIPATAAGTDDSLYVFIGVADVYYAPSAYTGIIGAGFTVKHEPDYLDGVTATAVNPGIAALSAGTYILTLEVNDEYISMVVHNSDGTERKIMREAHPGNDIGKLAIAFRDNRTTNGMQIGKLWARSSGTVMDDPQTDFFKQSPRVIFNGAEGTTSQPTPTADRNNIILPPGYDSRIPTPAVLVMHGSSGSAETWSSQPDTVATIEELVDTYGYIAMVPDAAFVAWGNTLSQDRAAAYWRDLATKYNVSHLFMLGISMGGIGSLNMIHNRKVAGVSAWYGMYPATNLAAQYAGAHESQIEAAYGFVGAGAYAAATDGNDPNLVDVDKYGGVPMRMSYSTGDTVVVSSDNAQAFQTKMAGSAVEVSLLVGTGAHGDPSQSDSSDINSFFQRAIGNESLI